MLQLGTLVLEHRRAAIFSPLLGAVLAAAISLLLPVWYTAKTTFVPETSSQGQLPSGLSGLAGQVGLTIGSGPEQSPEFYSSILTSRATLEEVLRTKYPIPDDRPQRGDSATLLQLLREGGRDASDSLYRGVKRLRELISVDVDDETNIVALSVDAHDPVLAANVARRFLQYLNDFNTNSRQSQAREKRLFLESRLAEAATSLTDAEGQLRQFYERNRSWQQSPSLVYEQGRLQRQVDIRQDLYLSLSHEYQAARLEEVNDTPVITTIDPAVPPARRARPKRAILTIVGFFAGAMIAVIYIVAAGYWKRAAVDRSIDYRKFVSVLQDARRDLASVVPRPMRRTRTPTNH